MTAFILWVWIYSYPNATVVSAEYSSREKCEAAYVLIRAEGNTRGHLCTEK